MGNVHRLVYKGLRILLNDGVGQRLTRDAHNVEVGGSIPLPVTPIRGDCMVRTSDRIQDTKMISGQRVEHIFTRGSMYDEGNIELYVAGEGKLLLNVSELMKIVDMIEFEAKKARTNWHLTIKKMTVIDDVVTTDQPVIVLEW